MQTPSGKAPGWNWTHNLCAMRRHRRDCSWIIMRELFASVWKQQTVWQSDWEDSEMAFNTWAVMKPWRLLKILMHKGTNTKKYIHTNNTVSRDLLKEDLHPNSSTLRQEGVPVTPQRIYSRLHKAGSLCRGSVTRRALSAPRLPRGLTHSIVLPTARRRIIRVCFSGWAKKPPSVMAATVIRRLGL